MPWRRWCVRLIVCALILPGFWTLMGAVPVSSAPAPESAASGKIVFSSNRDGNAEIYTVNADGSDLTRLTSNDHQDIDPKWSPDGERVLFTRSMSSIDPASLAAGSPKMSTTQVLFIMNADGSDQHRLTGSASDANAMPESRASWSPDGSRILFTRSPGTTLSSYHLYTINADGTDEQRIGPQDLAGLDLTFRAPQWSPDGQTILFEAGTRIWIMHADGSEFPDGQRALELTDYPDNGAAAHFSPDSNDIVFASNRDGDFDIFVMSRDGADQRPLTTNDVSDFDPAWSPTGSTILFLRDPGDTGHELWLMDRDSRQERVLAGGFSGRDSAFFMGSDWIAVQRWGDDDQRSIEIFAVDGSTSYILADTPASNALGSWHPDAISAGVTSSSPESAQSRDWPLAGFGVAAVAVIWRRMR